MKTFNQNEGFSGLGTQFEAVKVEAKNPNVTGGK